MEGFTPKTARASGGGWGEVGTDRLTGHRDGQAMGVWVLLFWVAGINKGGFKDSESEG